MIPCPHQRPEIDPLLFSQNSEQQLEATGSAVGFHAASRVTGFLLFQPSSFPVVSLQKREERIQ